MLNALKSELLTVREIAAPVRNALVGGPFGSDLTQKDYTSSGVPVIRGQNLAFGRWVGGEFVYVSEEKADSLSANIAVPGDIVFTQRGTLGQVAIVPEGAHPRYLISQSQMKLTVDTVRALPLYIYYEFISPDQQESIQANAIRVGVPHINLGMLRSMRLLLPSIEDQRRVAKILGDLDSKIEVNRQMAGTLEEMARTLFRAWFVEFLPARAKVRALAEGRDPERAAMASLSGRSEADLDTISSDSLARLRATAALFPEIWEEGDVPPHGWTDGTLGAFARLMTTGVQPSAEPDAVFEHYSIPAYDDGNGPAMDRGGSIKSGKYAVHSDAVLVSKLNPNTPRIWMPNVKTERAICSTEFMPFVPHDPKARAFLYLLMDSDEMREEVRQRVTGSTGSRQRAQPSQIAKLPVFVPPAEIVERFTEFVAPQLALASSLTAERQVLAHLRDTLLPALLAGNIPEVG